MFKFNVISSDPCFEIWLLLHFTYTTKIYSSHHKKSASSFVSDELRKYIDNYSKSDKSTFEKTILMLDFAIKNAEKLENFCKKMTLSNLILKPDYHSNTAKRILKGLRNKANSQLPIYVMLIQLKPEEVCRYG